MADTLAPLSVAEHAADRAEAARQSRRAVKGSAALLVALRAAHPEGGHREAAPLPIAASAVARGTLPPEASSDAEVAAVARSSSFSPELLRGLAHAGREMWPASSVAAARRLRVKGKAPPRKRPPPPRPRPSDPPRPMPTRSANTGAR